MRGMFQKLLIVLGLTYLAGHILILPLSFPNLWLSILMPALPVCALALTAAYFIQPFKMGNSAVFKIVLSLFAIAGLVKTVLDFAVGLQTRVLPFGLDIGVFAYIKKLIGPVMTLTQGLIMAAIILSIWFAAPRKPHGDVNV